MPAAASRARLLRRLSRGITWPLRRALDPRFGDIGHRLHLLSEGLHAATAELQRDIAQTTPTVERAVEGLGAETHAIRMRLDVLTRDVGEITRRLVDLDPAAATATRSATLAVSRDGGIVREPPRAMADPPTHPGTPTEQAAIATAAGLPDAIANLYATQRIERVDGSVLECFPMGIPVLDAVVLQELVRDYDRRRTLETGVGIGVSAAVIAAQHARRGDGIHVAMDPYHRDWFGGVALELLDAVGATGHATVLELESCVALADLAASGRRFDFAFIDGNHHFDATLVDFFLVDRVLEPGGHLVFHDVWMESVRRVLNFVLANRDYIEEPNADLRYLAVLRKQRDDSREWAFHDDAF